MLARYSFTRKAIRSDFDIFFIISFCFKESSGETHTLVSAERRGVADSNSRPNASMSTHSFTI